MVAQLLTWGLNGYGDFNDPVRWVPREAPTPGSGQTLNVSALSLSIAGQNWADYDLVLSGQGVGVTFANQTLDALSTVRQTAPLAYINVDGFPGLNNFAAFDLGTSGVQATTEVNVLNYSTFRNNGTIEVDGNLLVRGTGTFINNATVSVENGTALFERTAIGQGESSFIIGKGGTLEFGGYTNASVSFVPGENGRLLLDSPYTPTSVKTIKGFDKGDEIVIPGAVTQANYQGTAEGGVLSLGGANGAEVAQINFSGAYQTGNFIFAAAGEKTSITSNFERPQQPGNGGSVTAKTTTDTFQTDLPVLDLDTHGRRDAQYQVNAPNDVTLTMTKLVVRDTALSRAEFLDGSLVFDGTSPEGRYVADQEAAQIARMYYTVLGRGPEFAGAKYWVEDVMEAANVSIQQLAPGFYESREFKARYGENTTDDQFVGLLYQNVLGRAGEAEGVAFWTGRLAGGTGRAEVVVSFSESFENQAARYAVIEQSGIVFLDQPFL